MATGARALISERCGGGVSDPGARAAARPSPSSACRKRGVLLVGARRSGARVPVAGDSWRSDAIYKSVATDALLRVAYGDAVQHSPSFASVLVPLAVRLAFISERLFRVSPA